MFSKNQIKEIQALQLKKFREAKRLFIAEGIKTVFEVVAQAPALIETVFATEEIMSAKRGQLSVLGNKVIPVTEAELKKISLQATPSGVLAVCRYMEEPAAAFDFEKQFTFYLDDIRDPGNMGTIIRLADWFGMSTVFCSPDSCDVYNPKVIQSTMGAFLRVKLLYIGLDELLRKQNINTVYGAVLDGANLYKERLRNGLIVIGNEANGISAQNLSSINKKLTIPANHNNGTESLNAAMAASIIASEFFRQLRLD